MTGHVGRSGTPAAASRVFHMHVCMCELIRDIGMSHTACIAIKTHPGGAGSSGGRSGHSEHSRNTSVARSHQHGARPVGRVRHLSVVGLLVGGRIDLLHGARVTRSPALGHLLGASGRGSQGTARKEHAASDGGGEPHLGGGDLSNTEESWAQRRSTSGSETWTEMD